MHIATTETFFIGAPVIECKCWVCDIACDHEIGWIGTRCSSCKCVYNLEDTMPDIVAQRRRELLKLTRYEMAAATGYKIASIRYYELRQCSKPYFEKTLELVRLMPGREIIKK